MADCYQERYAVVAILAVKYTINVNWKAISRCSSIF